MSINLLVADDEDTIRRGVSKYIQLHTDDIDKVYEAENGEEAMEMILKHRPQIILLDVQMPLLSGIDVLKGIKKAGLNPVVIILSGYDEFKYAQQALKYGASEYLLKPIRANLILECVEKFISEKCSDCLEKENEAEESSQLIKDAKEYIEENYMEKISLTTMAQHLGVSNGYISTKFTENVGCGFVDYLNTVRVERACGFLEQGFFKTYEVANKVGFQDEKYFSRVFKKIKGLSPREYKKQY